MRKRNKHTKETKLKISKAKMGQKLSDEIKDKISKAKKGKPSPMKGKKHTKKTIEKMIESKKDMHIGENNPNWKGGITPIHKLLRNSKMAQEWRNKIFKRDNWTCQHCENRGGDLEVHHIYPWREYPELRYDIDNGITFCPQCHSIYDKYRNVGSNV